MLPTFYSLGHFTNGEKHFCSEEAELIFLNQDGEGIEAELSQNSFVHLK